MAVLSVTGSPAVLDQLQDAEDDFALAIVSSTATDNGDGTWTVTAMTDEANVPALTALGAAVTVAISNADELAQWQAVDAQIDRGPERTRASHGRLHDLRGGRREPGRDGGQQFATLCTRSGSDWAPGWSGGNSGYLKIAAVLDDSPASRWAVLITGGVHARELAPPDALVSFLGHLLRAYDAQRAITYPAWTDPVTGIVYDSFIISWPWVQRIVERLDLVRGAVGERRRPGLGGDAHAGQRDVGHRVAAQVVAEEPAPGPGRVNRPAGSRRRHQPQLRHPVGFP